MPQLLIEEYLFQAYSDARRRFLAAIGCDSSCRDPLAEFAERIIAKQLDGVLAESRVQPGYDLTTPDNRRVQVKYLANPAGRWRNEHIISFAAETDDYAIVFFEAFEVCSAIVFRRETIGLVCNALKKRHPNQEASLQLTQKNYKAIVQDPKRFEALGAICFLPGTEPSS